MLEKQSAANLPGFAPLLKSLSSKQDALFGGVVHFHGMTLSRLGRAVEGLKEKLGRRSDLVGTYTERQRNLHKLKVGGGGRDMHAYFVQTACTCIFTQMNAHNV